VYSRDIPHSRPGDLPDVFTSYRKSVEPLRDAPRRVLPTPTQLLPQPPKVPGQSAPFTIPASLESIISALHKPITLAPLVKNGPSSMPSGTESAHPFKGGSTAGHDRIEHLIQSASMTQYKDTRNGLLGTDFSTKLSAWLALGCITARQVHYYLVAFEDATDGGKWKGIQGYGKGENRGTAAVRFELLWRDYMRLCTRKFGPQLFHLSGFRNDDSYAWKMPNKAHPELQDTLTRFLNGTTGTGLIDASQRELFLTGYTSNRARQNVASFLSKHLGINWMLGAEWYESLLVDYDVSSNWGNWQYVAGVGNDPRGEARVFNPVKQAFDYDPEGEYIKAWVPELRGLDDPQKIFQAWKMSDEEKKERGLEGKDVVERPLKRIDFYVGRKGGGGGQYGGSSRNNRKYDQVGESGRGRGGGSFGARGAFRGRGRGGGGGGGETWRGQARQGMMDKVNWFQQHST
jgi:deoxyribodipyrimidine photo-lyase